ncbi:uncharacterized protein LOC109511255 isoform X2 [Hippocampus comes]|uniref:Mucin-2-like n=1 Tax=Hippocampus comes TaxID=109280 RepID=A0A3Q2YY73_HIPCM|nr:PREDICTED: uncharacterized protein LOC109511255 isoform X2 [Hippocampus comes]
MQLHVCLLLVVVAAAAVREEPRNSSEEDATTILHSDRDFPSPSQAGSDYTSTQEPYGGSRSGSGPATPVSASGSPDSEALRLPGEVGNNGAETSATRLPETPRPSRNAQTNPGLPEGTRGPHTSGRFTFPPVTSSLTLWTLLATPAGTAAAVYLKNLRRGKEVTSDPVWSAAWSQTDLSKSTQRTLRLPDAAEGTSGIPGSTGTTGDAPIVSGTIRNSSKLEDGTEMPRPASPTSTKTKSGRVVTFGDSEDGMETPSGATLVGVLTLGLFRAGTTAPNPLPNVRTVLVVGRVPDSEGQRGTPRYATQVGVLNFTEEGAGAPGQPTRARTTLSSGGVRNIQGSEDGSETPGHPSHVSAVTASEGFLSFGGLEDRTGTPGRSLHTSTGTASEGFLGSGASRAHTDRAGHSPQPKVLSTGGPEDGTGTPGGSLLPSTVLASGSEDVTETPRNTPQVELVNSGNGTAWPEDAPPASTIRASGGVQKSSAAEAATLGPTSQVAVSSRGGSRDGTATSGRSPPATTVTASGSVSGLASSHDTGGALDTTPAPATLRNPAVSPPIPDVLTRALTPDTAPRITQQMLTTELQGTRGGNAATAQRLVPEARPASTPSSFATTREPKVYVVPDQPATIRVESIELLLQIVADDSGSTSGPDLEEDTGAWVEPYLRRAPGFSRIVAVWASGRAVQMLLEFHSRGALRWLSASGASALLRQTGLDLVAPQGRSFRGSKVLNVTLGGVQEDICDWLLGCPAGFRCITGPSNNYSCSSVCHFDFCHHHGVCTHHTRKLPVCRCLVGEDFWFMGSRCDVRMTRTRLVCTCASVLVLAVAVIGALALVAVRRYRAALIRAKVDQTRSSYRRFNHFDELSSRFWPRSASAASADSMDNPAFTRSDELLHMRALDRPCCYHDDTLSLASASASASASSGCTGRAARLNTIYPDSSQYGWCGSELSMGDGVLDSGKASDLSVCSWPVEPIHWTPFPLLRRLAAPRHPNAARTSRPRSYCDGMELVDMNRSWTA